MRNVKTVSIHKKTSLYGENPLHILTLLADAVLVFHSACSSAWLARPPWYGPNALGHEPHEQLLLQAHIRGKMILELNLTTPNPYFFTERMHMRIRTSQQFMEPVSEAEAETDKALTRFKFHRSLPVRTASLPGPAVLEFRRRALFLIRKRDRHRARW